MGRGFARAGGFALAGGGDGGGRFGGSGGDFNVSVKDWFRAVIGGIIMLSVSTLRHSERNNAVVTVEESVGPTANQRYGQCRSPD
jgi:hypothetical protein